MLCQPPHPDSLADLQRLRQDVARRGDQCLSLLLAGIQVYVSVGREMELLEIMRKFVDDAEDMVRNTPTAAELKRLYEREDSNPPGN